MPKFIFVSGGVISGLGKGITTASLAVLLEDLGYRVAPVKCDAYVNVDAGTMNPVIHGETFVLADGLETDQDLGHYERFLGRDLSRVSYMTTGSVYLQVIKKERALKYDGACVEVAFHVPQEIIANLKKAARKEKADIVLAEIGGTVGEYQNILFLEANRMLKVEKPGGVLHLHVGYLPAPNFIGELKSKPVQNSIRQLNASGIQPDFLIGRAEKEIDEPRKKKIHMLSNVPVDQIIANQDVETIYEVPLVFKKQQLAEKVLKSLNLKPKRRSNLRKWKKIVERAKNGGKKIKIGVVGKYQKIGDYMLADAYVCVVEAVKHAAWELGLRVELVWLEAGNLDEKKLKEVDGIIVPQGWGKNGAEGKIKAAVWAIKHKKPYLGLCFGMQLATVAVARHLAGLKKANSEEVDSKTSYPVIHVMPEQAELIKKKQYGGTIRLGNWPCKIKPGTLLAKIYGNKKVVQERHRHRYEFNNDYREKLEKAGLVISGISPDGKLVEAVELDKKIHPFFVGTQYHPELISRPLRPHPVFLGFLMSL